MFKEKYLIFKGLENNRNDFPKQNAEKTKSKLDDYSGEVAKDLLTVKTEEIINEVEKESETIEKTENDLRKLVYDLGRKFGNISYDFIRRSDLVEKEILPFLKKGYELGSPYSVYVTDDMVILLNKNKKVTEERFLFVNYNSKLDFHESAAIAAKNGREYFNGYIFPVIKDYKPDFKDEKIHNNALIQQILHLLIRGYKFKDPYTIVATESGFQLSNFKDTQNFDLDLYNDDLELKPNRKVEEIIKEDFKTEADALGEFHKKLIIEESTESNPLGSTRPPTDGEMAEIYSQLDNIIKKCPLLQEIDEVRQGIWAANDEFTNKIESGEIVLKNDDSDPDYLNEILEKRGITEKMMNKYEKFIDEGLMYGKDKAASILYNEYYNMLYWPGMKLRPSS